MARYQDSYANICTTSVNALSLQICSSAPSRHASRRQASYQRRGRAYIHRELFPAQISRTTLKLQLQSSFFKIQFLFARACVRGIVIMIPPPLAGPDKECGSRLTGRIWPRLGYRSVDNLKITPTSKFRCLALAVSNVAPICREQPCSTSFTVT